MSAEQYRYTAVPGKEEVSRQSAFESTRYCTREPWTLIVIHNCGNWWQAWYAIGTSLTHYWKRRCHLLEAYLSLPHQVYHSRTITGTSHRIVYGVRYRTSGMHYVRCKTVLYLSENRNCFGVYCNTHKRSSCPY